MTGEAEWIGRVGRAWAEQWPQTDRAFAPLTARLITRLRETAPESGNAIDIGCGAGETSIALARLRPSLAVTGADVSDALIAAARTRLAEPNLEFVAGDAIATAGRRAPISLFVSRHSVMFFDAPVAAFSALHAAAAPGAQLVFTCFRDWSLNAFASDFAPLLGEGPPPAGTPGPFAFADEAYVRDLLSRSGWTDIAAEPVDYPYRAGEGPDALTEATALLSKIGPAARALREAPEADRPRLRAALTDICRSRQTGDAVDFPAAAWLWTAKGQA